MKTVVADAAGVIGIVAGVWQRKTVERLDRTEAHSRRAADALERAFPAPAAETAPRAQAGPGMALGAGKQVRPRRPHHSRRTAPTSRRT
jgi:hypothetical protein